MQSLPNFYIPLLTRINNIPPRNLPLICIQNKSAKKSSVNPPKRKKEKLTHHIINLLQLAHPNRLKRRLNDSTPKELKSLGGVLPVTDVGALDRLHLDDGFEDGGFEEGACREADGDDGAAGSDVLGFRDC